MSKKNTFFILFVLILGQAIGSFIKIGNYQERIAGLEKQAEKSRERIISLNSSRLWENKEFPYLKEIRKAIETKKPQSVHDRIVLVRKYIREAFILKYDDWYSKNKYNTAVVLETIYRYHLDNKNEKAHLDCQPSARILASILYSYGLNTRLVAFLSDDSDKVLNHAALEVFNPDTNSWELHDALYDLHFIDKTTRHVLSAIDLAFGPLDQIIPSNGESEGWVETSKYSSDNAILLKLFEVLAYNHPTRKCFVLINLDRVSLSKTFPENDGVDIVDFLNNVYGNPPIIALRASDQMTLPMKLSQFL